MKANQSVCGLFVSPCCLLSICVCAVINQVVFEIEEREDLVPFDEEWEAQRAAQVTFSEMEVEEENKEEEEEEEEDDDDDDDDEEDDEDDDDEDEDEVCYLLILLLSPFLFFICLPLPFPSFHLRRIAFNDPPVRPLLHSHIYALTVRGES